MQHILATFGFAFLVSMSLFAKEKESFGLQSPREKFEENFCQKRCKTSNESKSLYESENEKLAEEALNDVDGIVDDVINSGFEELIKTAFPLGGVAIVVLKWLRIADILERSGEISSIYVVRKIGGESWVTYFKQKHVFKIMGLVSAIGLFTGAKRVYAHYY